MDYKYLDVHSAMRQHVRDTAAFYSGFIRLMDGDDDNDEGFHFLSRIFQIAIEIGGEGVMGQLDYYAVGYIAGLFGEEHDPETSWRRSLALHELLRVIGKADLDQAGIEALTAQVEGGPATSERAAAA